MDRMHKVNLMQIEDIPRFNRDLFGSRDRFSGIGGGCVGGKARGLIQLSESLTRWLNERGSVGALIDIPVFTVIGTDVFEQFMQMNHLYETIEPSMTDERIAHAFQQAEFPYAVLGDLRGMIEKIHTPLAVRSSSLLEDAAHHPFAGVYGTKMIPNNQPDADTRFKKLIEAIKFVYASTFFIEARDYMKAAGKEYQDEKMAVIVQEIVGRHHGERYYPDIAGVGRSFNYYPFGSATAEDRVVILALGLGKTIVDGGRSWSVCPRYPKQPPPYGSPSEIMKHTQSKFWAVNMGKPPAFDPTVETEYMAEYNLTDAEYDGTLNWSASTYQAERDRIVLGIGNDGPRVLDFGPLFQIFEPSILRLVSEIMELCEKQEASPVEMEFAMTIENSEARVGLLQVRPMVVADEKIEVSVEDMKNPNCLLNSRSVVGNGSRDQIKDIVYVRPEVFEAARTPIIAEQIGEFNRELTSAKTPYLLIGFGRWGSSDPWLGIPVVWSQIAGAAVLVEATLPNMDVELSQGAHFFQNITSFKVPLLNVRHSGEESINFDWLDKKPAIRETEFVRHVRIESPLLIKVDGRNGRGVALYE